MRQGYGEFVKDLKPDEVFVFGSNKSGFHGAGSAGFASFGRSGNVWREERYADKPKGWKGKWNVKGQGEGLQEGAEGKSYALPTVWKAGQKRSLSREEIVQNVGRMYACAKGHPGMRFLVAGSTSGRLLCGYSHEELCGMYAEASPIPDNVVFSDSYTRLVERYYVCPTCHCECDTWVCHCGVGVEEHRYETHGFVPQGCSCGYGKAVDSAP